MSKFKKVTGSPSVFIIDSVGEHRGMHYHNFPLAAALSESGLDVSLLSTSETIENEQLPLNIHAYGVFRRIYGKPNKYLRGIRYGLALGRIALLSYQRRPQIAHFHFYQVPQIDQLLLRWLSFLGIKTISSVHDVLPFHLKDDFSSPKSKIYLHLYELSAGLILHSKFGLDKLLEQAPQLGEKSIVIPLGNYNAFKEKVSAQVSKDTNRIKSDLGYSPEEKLLLIFGTIKPNKRLDWVIQALPLVIASHLDTRLLIVGKPQDREITADQNLARELGVEEQINWHTNRVSDEELAQYFSIADILIFPYEWIYQSAAILMAMSFSKPIIATSVGSNQDIIQDRYSGILVPPNEPQTLAKAITALLDRPDWGKQIGESANKFVTQELSWKNLATKTREFYLKVLAN